MFHPRSPEEDVMANPKCTLCGKTVYPMELIRAKALAFHKLCFKCSSSPSLPPLQRSAALSWGRVERLPRGPCGRFLRFAAVFSRPFSSAPIGALAEEWRSGGEESEHWSAERAQTREEEKKRE